MTVPVKPYTFTGGVGNKIRANEVNADFDTLYSLLDAGLQADNLKPGDNIFDHYIPIAEAYAWIGSGAGAALDAWILHPYEGTLDTNLMASGANPSSRGYPDGLVSFDDADYKVAGKTLRLKIRALCVVNGAAPGITFTPKLFPITGAGGTAGPPNRQFLSLGAAAGAGPVIATPGANTAIVHTGSDFTAPADGPYALGVTLSNAVAAASLTSLFIQLLARSN